MAKEYIEREAVLKELDDLISNIAFSSPYQDDINVMVGGMERARDCVEEATSADVVEVVSGYREGDVCIYGFGHENKSSAIVEIVKILSDERGVAEVKFLKVFVDDTGNGLFDYLLKSGKTMNASFRYLKNITPRKDDFCSYGERRDNDA